MKKRKMKKNNNYDDEFNLRLGSGKLCSSSLSLNTVVQFAYTRWLKKGPASPAVDD